MLILAIASLDAAVISKASSLLLRTIKYQTYSHVRNRFDSRVHREYPNVLHKHWEFSEAMKEDEKAVKRE